jgi:O-antigen/teichoic acid export membrane protein
MSLQYSQTYLWTTSSSRRSLVQNAKVLSLFVGALVGIATWVIVWLAGNHLVPIPGLWLLAAALAAVPATIGVINLTNLLVLDDRINRVNVAYAVGAVCQVAAVVVLALAGLLTIGSALLTWVVSEIVPAVLLVQALTTSRRDFSAPLARRTLALGLRYHIGVAFLFLLFRADILILNSMVRSAQVGRYALAATLAEVTYLSADAIAQVMLPRQMDSNIEESGELTVRIVRMNALVAVMSSALILVGSEFLLLTVFGHAYAGVLSPLAVLMPGVVALAGVRAASGFLIRLNQPITFAITSGGAMILNIVLNLLLIPAFGIVGSALASSVAYTALAACYVVWISRATGIRLGAFAPGFHDVLLARDRLHKDRDLPG